MLKIICKILLSNYLYYKLPAQIIIKRQMIEPSQEVIEIISSSSSQSSEQSKNDLFENIEFKCLQGSKGMLYCMTCNNSAIVCNNQNCDCYIEHASCQTFQRITVFNSKLNSKRITTNNFAQLTSIFDGMVNLVSKLKEEVNKSYENFGLNTTDVTLIKAIRGLSEGKILKGTDFAVHKANQSKQNNWSGQTFSRFQALKNLCLDEFLQFTKLLSQKLLQQLQNKTIKFRFQQPFNNICQKIVKQNNVKIKQRPTLDEIIQNPKFNNQLKFQSDNQNKTELQEKEESKKLTQTKNGDKKVQNIFGQNPFIEKTSTNSQNIQTNLFGRAGKETETNNEELFENSFKRTLFDCPKGIQLFGNPQVQSLFGKVANLNEGFSTNNGKRNSKGQRIEIDKPLMTN